MHVTTSPSRARRLSLFKASIYVIFIIFCSHCFRNHNCQSQWFQTANFFPLSIPHMCVCTCLTEGLISSSGTTPAGLNIPWKQTDPRLSSTIPGRTQKHPHLVPRFRCCRHRLPRISPRISSQATATISIPTIDTS